MIFRSRYRCHFFKKQQIPSSDFRLLASNFFFRRKTIAFTLAELLVAMVITSLVIAIGYTAWMLIQKQQLRYEEKAVVYEEIARFETQLRWDVDQCDSISGNNNTLSLRLKQGDVSYRFPDSLVVRTTIHSIDTFFVNILGHNLDYNYENGQNAGLYRYLEIQIDGEITLFIVKKAY